MRGLFLTCSLIATGELIQLNAPCRVKDFYTRFNTCMEKNSSSHTVIKRPRLLFQRGLSPMDTTRKIHSASQQAGKSRQDEHGSGWKHCMIQK